MAAFDRTTDDVVRPLLPDIKKPGVVAHRIDFPPQHENGTRDLAAFLMIVGVLQIVHRGPSSKAITRLE